MGYKRTIIPCLYEAEVILRAAMKTGVRNVTCVFGAPKNQINLPFTLYDKSCTTKSDLGRSLVALMTLRTIFQVHLRNAVIKIILSRKQQCSLAIIREGLSLGP